MTGWTRLFVVISGTWIFGVMTYAFLTQPRPAGGWEVMSEQPISGVQQVANAVFWLPPANPFDQFDNRPSPKKGELSDADMGLAPQPARFNWRVFLAASFGPIILLWAAFLSLRWVITGFRTEA